MANFLHNLMTRKERIRRRSHVGAGFQRMTGLHYHEVLKEIERRMSPDWYVEIGSRSGTSISHRKCNFIAVDPVFAIDADVFNSAKEMHFIQRTSDDFFEGGFLAKLGIVPDFAFIDGMHLFEFALRDFMNLEAAMQSGGLIALHDVCPFDAPMTTRKPEDNTTPFAWTGDVWKTLVILKEFRPDLQLDVLNSAGTGLVCVRNLDPTNKSLRENYDAILETYTEMSLADFGVEAFFNLIEPRRPEEFLQELGETV